MDLQHNAEIAKTENRFVKVENYHLWPSAPHSTGSSEGAGKVIPNVFRRLQNNSTSTSSVISNSMNLRASVANANLHSTDSAKGSNSVGTDSSGSSAPNHVPNVDATRLATARNIVTGHAHKSGSIAAGIPSASITTSASASTSDSASASGTVAPQAGYNSHHQVCARYMGSIGGTWPTVQVRIFVIVFTLYSGRFFVSFGGLQCFDVLVHRFATALSFILFLLCVLTSFELFCRGDTGFRILEISNLLETLCAPPVPPTRNWYENVLLLKKTSCFF